MADDKGKEAKDDAKKTVAVAVAAAPAGGGGIKAMLPLIITIVLMPVLAFAMTQFVLLPKLQQAITASATTKAPVEGEDVEVAVDGHDPAPPGGGQEPAAPGGHGAVPADGAPKKIAKGEKTTVPLAKVIVNVKDTQATRYLMSSYTLVGKGEEFKTTIEANMEQIRDVAATVLSTKNIQELEKPDARNIIKSELISTINTALGKPAVKEIYVTEFVIQ